MRSKATRISPKPAASTAMQAPMKMRLLQVRQGSCAPGATCNAALISAPSLIPGVLFSGSNDGGVRGYATKDGAVLWEFDTNQDFTTLNRVRKAYEALREFFMEGFVYIQSFCKLAFCLAAMSWFSPRLGLVVALISAVTLYATTRFDRSIIRLRREYNEADHAVSANLFDTLSNITTVITLRLERSMESGLMGRLGAYLERGKPRSLADGAGGDRPPDGLRHVLRHLAVAAFEIDRDREIRRRADAREVGDREIERRIKSLVRWNAAAMVVRHTAPAAQAPASRGGRPP